MSVQSTRLPRARRLAVSADLCAKVALASAIALYAIIVSGATVRVTASGLGCEAWPGCEAGSFFPERDYHGVVEFGNRVVALLPLSLSLAAWIIARRTQGLPRWASRLAAGTFLGTLAQAPLGRLTIVLDLHPLMVMAHFLLSLVVLAGAVVVAVEAWGNAHGRGTPAPGAARRAGLVVVTSCALLLLTGSLSTAAGPHSGGADVERFGLLVDAVYVHVRAAAVFAVVFGGLLGYLVVRRREAPRLLALAVGLVGLLVAQAIVGEVQWRTELPWGLVLAHVALAAGVWALLVALVAALYRPPASLVPGHA